MPNTGAPSKACHLCRKRRAKCDLNQPGCLKCAKLGFSCPGYRDEQDLLFHNQSVTSYGQKKKTQKPLKRKSLQTRGPPSSTNGLVIRNVESDSNTLLGTGQPTDTSAVYRVANSLPPHIPEDWKLCSIAIVLRQFSAPSCNTCNRRYFGYLDFLPNLYVESGDSSCLSLATTAVAKIYFSNMYSTMPGGYDHLYIYSHALRALQRALDDPSERSKDSTIICVWLLTVFEILQYYPRQLSGIKPNPDAWQRHSEGLLSLLRTRGLGQFRTIRGRNIFWMMYAFIQTRCLTTNTACPAESVQWFDSLRSNLSDHDRLAFTVCEYNYKISVLCSKIQCCLREDEKDNDLLATLLLDCLSLKSDIEASQTINTSMEKDSTSIYFRNMFHTATIKLQHFTLKIIDHLSCYRQLTSAELFSQHQDCVNTIHLRSRKVLDSVSLLLPTTRTNSVVDIGCWADAMRLTWPLTTISSVTYSLEEHREEAISTLQRIGWQMGVRLALKSRSSAGGIRF